LVNTIGNLDSFEIAQQEQAEEADGNKFQRCELVITDDKGNEFVAKYPLVIQATVEFIKGRFIERLAEVEAEIVITF
jgi:hypothetical protein